MFFEIAKISNNREYKYKQLHQEWMWVVIFIRLLGFREPRKTISIASISTLNIL
jgi:hypothetical protein